MHAKPDLRVFLKWMIAGSGSVITDVIQTQVIALMQIRLRTILVVVALGFAVLAASPQLLRLAFPRLARIHEVRSLLNHESIRDTGRLLVESLGPNFSIDGDDKAVPAEIRTSNPVRIVACEGWLHIEYGDGHRHFGLDIAPPGEMQQVGDGERVTLGVFFYQSE